MPSTTPLNDEPEAWPVAYSTDLHRDDWVVALRSDRIQRPGHLEEEPFTRLVLEHPVEVARRELLEEAELEAGEWTHLTTTYSSPGLSDELMHFYLARDLRPADRGDFVPEHEEADMETFWVPYEDLVAAVLEGRIRDAPVVVAVLLAQARGLAGSDRTGG